MTTYEFEGYFRQETGLKLFAQLGASRDWAHFLNDCSRGKTLGLRGSGPALLPIAFIRYRPIYDQNDINAFVREAKLFDPTLGPLKTVTPTLYEMNSEALHPLIPAGMRKVTVCRHKRRSRTSH